MRTKYDLSGIVVGARSSSETADLLEFEPDFTQNGAKSYPMSSVGGNAVLWYATACQIITLYNHVKMKSISHSSNREADAQQHIGFLSCRPRTLNLRLRWVQTLSDSPKLDR